MLIMSSMDAASNGFFEKEQGILMEERVHKTMTWTGALNIAVGIVSIVAGLASGVLLIVSGSKLLSDRKKLLF